MANTAHRWSEDWSDRLVKHIGQLGHSNVIEFLATAPGEPYEIIAQSLNVPPIQLISIHLREAKSLGQIREAAKDCLVRNLNEQFPNGWGLGENPDGHLLLALSNWISSILVSGECEYLKPVLLSIAIALREQPPHLGWRPISANDQIIQELFDKIWIVNGVGDNG